MIQTQELTNRPVLALDMKKNRIRVHRITLHLLGDPDYIQLLVNPDDKVVIIKKSKQEDRLSLHIRWKQLGEKQCCEFTSKSLLESIRSLQSDWVPDQTYKIYGNLYHNNALAAFPLNNSIVMNPPSEMRVPLS